MVTYCKNFRINHLYSRELLREFRTSCVKQFLDKNCSS
jgi:hypothetical protein